MIRILIIPVLCCLLFSCGGEAPKALDPKTDNIDSLYTSFRKSGKKVPMDVLIAHGNLMLDRYDYDKALKDGAEAYRREPENLDARLLYAMGLNNRADRSHSDIVSAQKHLKFILKKRPKDLSVLVQLAATYAQIGDTEKAFHYCNEALRIDKHYRDAYILKGKIYDAAGNTKLALSSFETAIQQDPNFYPAYLYIGEIYQYDKNDSLCIQYYQSADQIEPKNIEILYKLAYAYQTFHKDEKALETYRRMAQIDPEFTVSLFQQGWIKQFHQNQIDSAVIYYDRTLQKEPRYVEAWYNLGLIYEENKKDKYEAIKCYRMSVKYDKDFELGREALKRLSK